MSDETLILREPLLPIYRYQFQFTRPKALKLPQYAGSAWRGAFGHALKRTVCVVRNTPCAECMLKSTCAYSYIFETPPPANSGKMRKYNASPHPFVLQFPDTESQDSDFYIINLLVFGHGQRFFPYMVHALQRAGREGIGSSRQVFELQQIKQMLVNDEEIVVFKEDKLISSQTDRLTPLVAMPSGIEINIQSPIRIKQNGKNLNPQNFNFGGFFGNLIRRISMLTYFHTDTPLEIDFASLTRQAKETSFNTQNLQWYDWTRYSSRQKTEMNMGGVVGTLGLDLKNNAQFWPYLWLGQWTHVGKATSMGLGHYSLKATSLSDK